MKCRTTLQPPSLSTAYKDLHTGVGWLLYDARTSAESTPFNVVTRQDVTVCNPVKPLVLSLKVVFSLGGGGGLG